MILVLMKDLTILVAFLRENLAVNDFYGLPGAMR